MLLYLILRYIHNMKFDKIYTVYLSTNIAYETESLILSFLVVATKDVEFSFILLVPRLDLRIFLSS